MEKFSYFVSAVVFYGSTDWSTRGFALGNAQFASLVNDEAVESHTLHIVACMSIV